MKEKILLSNLNERELLRSLANNNINTFNLRVFNSEELAKEALLRNGKYLKGEKISTFKQQCVVFSLIKNSEYFKNTNFSDCKNVVSVLNSARYLCRGDEEEKLNEVLSDGEFKEKNNAILEIYKGYSQYKKDNNLYDSVDVVNEAIKNTCSFVGEFITFKESKLRPLEEKLIETVSNNNYANCEILEFIGKEEKKLEGTTFDNAYGSINEIEYVLSYIAKNNIPYDNAQLLICDPSYTNQILNYTSLNSVPLTSSLGYPIIFSNAFVVLDLLVKWQKNYNSLGPLLALLNSKEFDSDKFFGNISEKELTPFEKKIIIKQAGRLRLNASDNEDKINNYKQVITEQDEIKNFPVVEKIAQELEKGFAYIISTYSKIREDKKTLDLAGQLKITRTINEYIEAFGDVNIEDVRDELSNTNVCKEASAPGKLCLCDLSSGYAIRRKHLFIMGLNAKSFPGSPRENYLLLDSDLERFNELNIPTSEAVVASKKDQLFNIISFASALDTNIHISYSGYSLTDLKEENPSSLFFEIFKMENGDLATTDMLNDAVGEQHRYFSENVSSNMVVGNKYIEGVNLKESVPEEDEFVAIDYKKEISPSAAEKYFECPKRFFLKYILRLNEPDEEDPLNVLPSNELGTLVHKCMEDLGNNPTWNLEKFMGNAEKLFDGFLKKRIPAHTGNLDNIKRDYLAVAEYGFSSDPENKKVIGSEVKVGPQAHDSGLIFGGRVDRIEENLETGHKYIVDYKTYDRIKNEEDDIETGFQAILYAYLLEKEGHEVDGGEFRYLKNPNVIKESLNESTKNELDKKIMEIKESMDSGFFPCFEDDESSPCKYCKYAYVCGKNKLVVTKESEEVENG